MGWTPLNERISNTRRPVEKQTGMVIFAYLIGPLLLVGLVLGVLDFMAKR